MIHQMLLIGKTGSGKSATGNIIFNETVFVSKISSSSVTRVCQTHSGAVNNRRVTVIDTPDFIFSTYTDFDSDSELKRALELCSPGAHVILLILPLSTVSEHEKDFIGWFEQKFGAEALRFTLVLFTHVDKTHQRPLRALIRRNIELSAFINRCGGGFCGMNIKDPANRRQVTELMEKIDRLVFGNTNSCYTLEMMEETEKRREEERRRAEEEKRRQEERREREHQMTLERVRRETEIHVKREFKEKLELERVKILEKKEKAENREQHSLLQQIKLKSVCVFMVFAVVTGGVLAWKEDSSHGRMFMRGFFTGGLAATAGHVTGFLCRRLWKDQFMMIRPSSHESPRPVNPLVPMTLSILCGAAVGHYVGGNLLPVTVLAGLAGAAGDFTSIQ